MPDWTAPSDLASCAPLSGRGLGKMKAIGSVIWAILQAAVSIVAGTLISAQAAVVWAFRSLTAASTWRLESIWALLLVAAGSFIVVFGAFDIWEISKTPPEYDYMDFTAPDPDFALPIPSEPYSTYALVILSASTIVAHAVARLCPQNELTSRYWRAVDYPWVLAAFGSLVLAVGKVDLDRDAKQYEEARRLAQIYGSLLDSECQSPVHFRDLAGTAYEHILREQADVCMTLKDPFTVDEIWERDRVIQSLAPELREQREFIMMFSRPAFQVIKFGGLEISRDRECKTYGEKYETVFGGDGQPIKTASKANLWGPDWMSPGAPDTPMIHFFAHNFCLQIQAMRVTRSNSREFRQSFGVRLYSWMASDLSVWYLTLAVFAGIRLGKTAYETRPPAPKSTVPPPPAE